MSLWPVLALFHSWATNAHARLPSPPYARSEPQSGSRGVRVALGRASPEVSAREPTWENEKRHYREITFQDLSLSLFQIELNLATSSHIKPSSLPSLPPR